MTGTVTTAVRPATVCPLGTTRQPSPTHPCTSSPWDPVRSSRRRTPATTPSTALIWTTGTREEAGSAEHKWFP